MINEIMDWALNLFVWKNFGYFAAGFASAWIWQCAWAYVRKGKIKFRWRPLIYVLCAAIVFWIMSETREANRCIQEFNKVLHVRTAISAENDAISIEQRKLVYDWIHALVFPPPDIAKLDNADPVRTKWAIQMTLDVDAKFEESLQRQRENDEERAAHPLPEPTCGR